MLDKIRRFRIFQRFNRMFRVLYSSQIVYFNAIRVRLAATGSLHQPECRRRVRGALVRQTVSDCHHTLIIPSFSELLYSFYVFL